MAGAQSIMTGVSAVGGAFVPAAAGLTRLKKWSRNPSRVVPTPEYVCSKVIPAVISHLWTVKGWRASPTLVLPRVMPPDVSGTSDMEANSAVSRPYWVPMVGGAARMLFPGFTAGIGRNTIAIVAVIGVVLLLGAVMALWP
jgi:hypothetical protein